MMKIKKNDRFIAVVKKGEHSRTFGGAEGAGTKLGPFVAWKVEPGLIEIKDGRQFTHRLFSFEKVKK